MLDVWRRIPWWVLLLLGALVLLFAARRYEPFWQEVGAMFDGREREGFVIVVAAGVLLVLLGLLRLVSRKASP